MLNQWQTWQTLRNAVLFAAFVYIIIVIVLHIIDVLLVFSIITLIVLALDPIVAWFCKHGIPRGVTTAALALAFLGLVGVILFFVLPIAGQQLADLMRQLPKLLAKAQGWLSHFTSRYPSLGKSIPKLNVASLVEFSKPLTGGIATITSDLIYIIAAAVLIFVSTIYTLINPVQLMEGFLKAIDPKYRSRAIAGGKRLAIQIRAWVFGVIISMFTIFALVYIALTLLGIKQALLFGIIAGILELVPVVGPILAAVPPVIVALIQNPIQALWVVVAFTFIQQFENHVLIPVVMSRQVKLHPITVIFAVLVMGALYGIIGIFLATPAAVTVSILYSELYLCDYAKRCNEAGPVRPHQEDLEGPRV